MIFRARRAALALLAISLGLANISGCHAPRKPVEPFWSFLSAGLFWMPTVYINWGAPLLFTLNAKQPIDLSPVNVDRFFPKDATRILVSKEAYEAGLFRLTYVPGSDGDLILSPDGVWTAQRVRLVHGGVENEVVDIGKVGEAKRNAWAVGRFNGLYWSPNSDVIAINEVRGSGTKHVYLFTLKDWGLNELQVSSADLATLLSDAQLAEPQTRVFKRWLSPRYVVVWVHALPLQSDSIPRWGYEAIVDVQSDDPNTARVSRAYVR